MYAIKSVLVFLCCPYKQLVHMLTCMQYKCSYVSLSSLQATCFFVIFSLVCFVRTDKSVTFVFDKCLMCIYKDDLG